MKQQVNFKCKIASCKKYAKGIIITGKVQRGKIVSLSKAILCSNTTQCNFDSSSAVIIHRIYVSGRIVQECVKGQQVSIYIEGVTLDQIIPNVSYLTTTPEQMEVNKESHKYTSVESSTNIKIHNMKKINTPKDTSSIREEMDRLADEIAKELFEEEISYESNYKTEFLNSEEKSYVTNVKLCMSINGYIAPTELFVLDKIRMILGIPPNRAKELLLDIVDEYKINRDESIYKDAVAMCLLDGNFITKTERSLLICLQELLHISDSKASDIEEKCKW